MKKIFTLMFVLICLSWLFGCNNNAQTQNDDFLRDKAADEIKPTELSDYNLPIENIDFNAQYIRTECNTSEEEYPKTFWITDAAELNEYYEENKENYYLDSREDIESDQSVGFIDAISKYDDKFFESNDLIFVVLEEPSGSIRHKVTEVVLQPSIMDSVQYFVQPVIERLVPEVGTCDMAEWHIIIEVSKEYGPEKARLLEAVVD